MALPSSLVGNGQALSCAWLCVPVAWVGNGQAWLHAWVTGRGCLLACCWAFFARESLDNGHGQPSPTLVYRLMHGGVGGDVVELPLG